MRILLLFIGVIALATVTPLAAQSPEPFRIILRIDSDLYSFDANGEDLTQFPFDQQQFQRIESAVWSPDGTQVLLLMVVDDPSARLLLADSDGSNPRLLLDNPVAVNAAPRWSSDGAYISYIAMVDGQQQLVVMEADGSHQQLAPPVAWDAPRPSMSPDGRRVALLSGLLNHLTITIADLETGQSTELVHKMADDYYGWSPAGDTIAFHHWGGSEDIYTANIETGVISQLVQDEQTSEELYFAWSPDGSQIAVTSNLGGYWEIFTMNPDGSDLHQLTEGTHDPSLLYYSPDGQWIAYRDSRELWIIRPDGSEARQMTFDEKGQGFLTWSPDSAEIMVSGQGEDQHIRIVNVESGEVRDLPTPPGASPFSQWIGAYSP